MPFEFKTQEERNPVKHPLEDKVAGLEKQVAKMDEFLELIGKAHLYDAWLEGEYTPQRDSSEGTYAEVIE